MMHGLPKGLRCLPLETFEPCVGEEFDVDSKPVAIRIRLERLIKHSQGPGFLTRAPYTLIWSTAASVNMVLGTYRLRNGGWGPHEVYIEPMSAAGERRAYQSVFF